MADDPFAVRAKKRWRAWLRSVHRDFGYVSVGFTFIYAISGIAQNHIEEWGDVSFATSERQVALAPGTIDDKTPDATAIAAVEKAAGRGAPTDTYRAGDEVRLTFGDGTKASAIGNTVTIQERHQRFLIGAANWLHRARGKPAWKYISDIYALMLLYLSISGLLLIKGKLGLRWRGTILVVSGICVPVLYVALSGGPTSSPDKPPELATKPTAAPPAPSALPTPPPTTDPGSAVLKPLPPDED